MDRSLRQSQVPSTELSYNWWGFQAWDTLHDSTDNSSIDKVETSLEWQVYFSQFQIRLMPSLVTSILLYACESWTLTAELKRRKEAMEMMCYHTILHISYKDHFTNEEVHTKIQQAIGPSDDHRDANCSGMVMFPVHQVWPKPCRKAQWKGEEDKADRGRGGKTTSGNGQA